MEQLEFKADIMASAWKKYFEKVVLTTNPITNHLEVYLEQLIGFLGEYLRRIVEQRGGIKVFPTLFCNYDKPLGEEMIQSQLPLTVKSFIILDPSQVTSELETFGKTIRTRNENILRNQSFLNLVEVSHLELQIAQHNPLNTGSGYVELPHFLAAKKCIINVKNSDNRCFGYSVLSAISSVDRNNNPSHPRHYNHKFGWRGLDQLQYPVDISDIPVIEQKLDVGFNVYSFYDDEGRARYPLHICKEEYDQHIDLLFWADHYAWIKDFNRFMYDITGYEHRKFFCKKCLGHFNDEVKLAEHSKNCTPNEGLQQVIAMPLDPKPLKFSHQRNQQRIPFIIYADFECLLPPIDKQPGAAQHLSEYQRHVPYSVGIKLISTVPELANIAYKEHHGLDSTQWLMEELIRIEYLCKTWLFKEERIIFNNIDRRNYDRATQCYLCHKEFADKAGMRKVRDHDHLTGMYRGAAHSHCNIQMRKTYKVPVFFHNFRGYDSHLVVQSLNKFPQRKISVIGQAMEKYISLSCGDHLVFKDSLQFMNCSLEQLVSNLVKSGKDNFIQLKKEFAGKPWELLLRKGIYPYDYVDTPQRFSEPTLPPQPAFYSKLRDEGASDEDYKHAQDVWKAFGCTRFADYHSIYLKGLLSQYFFLYLVLALTLFIILNILSYMYN